MVPETIASVTGALTGLVALGGFFLSTKDVKAKAQITAVDAAQSVVEMVYREMQILRERANQTDLDLAAAVKSERECKLALGVMQVKLDDLAKQLNDVLHTPPMRDSS